MDWYFYHDTLLVLKQGVLIILIAPVHKLRSAEDTSTKENS